MNIDDVNQSIIDLFIKFYGKEHQIRSPLLYNKLKQGCIVFIGLNPSFNIKAINKMISHKKIKSKDLFSIINVDKYHNDLLELELKARTDYPYFSKFNEISKENNLEWEHIDLYFERETKQILLLKKYISSKEYIDFANNQYSIFRSLIENINPKLLICVNAGASNIIQDIDKNNLEFSEELGTYLFKINNYNIPMFFSGMLTGQRALDLGSYERLKWHIRYVLKNVSHAI